VDPRRVVLLELDRALAQREAVSHVRCNFLGVRGAQTV
jgi:hypothetical protein